jgi:hypothetical protein
MIWVQATTSTASTLLYLLCLRTSPGSARRVFSGRVPSLGSTRYVPSSLFAGFRRSSSLFLSVCRARIIPSTASSSETAPSETTGSPIILLNLPSAVSPRRSQTAFRRSSEGSTSRSTMSRRSSGGWSRVRRRRSKLSTVQMFTGLFMEGALFVSHLICLEVRTDVPLRPFLSLSSAAPTYETHPNDPYSIDQWNLNNMPILPGSVLRYIKQNISGM